MQRGFADWLELLKRIRPTTDAVERFRQSWQREQANFTATQVAQLEHQLQELEQRAQSALAQQAQHAQRPSINLEHQPQADAQRGRLYLEVIGCAQTELLENPELDALLVFAYTDETGCFAGWQIDQANSLPERLKKIQSLLEQSHSPQLDCPEAQLEDVGLATLLGWVCTHRIA